MQRATGSWKLTVALGGGLAALALHGTEAAAASGETVAHPFEVRITTSPKAQAKLRSLGEKVKILAFYAGPPVPAKKKLAIEGEIVVGAEENVTLPLEGGTARLKGEMSREKLGWVTAPALLINVVSARLKHPDNLLACDLFSDTIEVARKRPIELHCKLIEE